MISVHLKALPHQATLYKWGYPGSKIAMVGGLGTGKTRALVTKAILLSIKYPNYNGLLIEPTYRMMADVLVPTWEEVVQQDFPWLRFTYRKGEEKLRLTQFNVNILLRSADDPMKLRGPNLGWCGIDEPGMMDHEAFASGSGRARIGPCRQTFLCGTPEGINWFADLFDVPEKPYHTIHANCWHPSMGYYEEDLKATYKGQPQKLLAYTKGYFVPLHEGRVYPTFDKRHISNIAAFDFNRPLHLACDFNVNPLAWLVVQKDGNKLLVIDEIEINGTTWEAADEFIKRFPRTKVLSNELTIYGDRSGNSRSTRSNLTDYQIMRQIFEEAGYFVRMKVPEANPPVIDRVNSVCKAFSDDLVLLNPKCQNTAKSFYRTTWKLGTRSIDKPAGELHTHWSDALGYMIAKVKPIPNRHVLVTHQTSQNSSLNGNIWQTPVSNLPTTY